MLKYRTSSISVGTKLFHADRRTDTTTLTVAFRNFAKAPKNWAPDTKYMTGQPEISEQLPRFNMIPCQFWLLSFTTLYVLLTPLCFFLPSLAFLGLPSGHFPAQHPRIYFTTHSYYMSNASSTHKFYYCFNITRWKMGCLKQTRQRVSARKETRNFVLESAWKERYNFIIISRKHKKKCCWIDDRLFPLI